MSFAHRLPSGRPPPTESRSPFDGPGQKSLAEALDDRLQFWPATAGFLEHLTMRNGHVATLGFTIAAAVAATASLSVSGQTIASI